MANHRQSCESKIFLLARFARQFIYQHPFIEPYHQSQLISLYFEGLSCLCDVVLDVRSFCITFYLSLGIFNYSTLLVNQGVYFSLRLFVINIFFFKI